MSLTHYTITSKMEKTISNDSEELRKAQMYRVFYEAFRSWFVSSGVDFWSECSAPEELATIAVEKMLESREQVR